MSDRIKGYAIGALIGVAFWTLPVALVAVLEMLRN
jgi:hypothetical protein